MCGIIAYKTNESSLFDKLLIDKLLIESSIRGKHSTGISFLKNNKIITISESIPAKEFIKKFDFEDINDEGKINLIGHTRYSTSDLKYNQPIADDKFSVVHNGVITQEQPEKWEKIYGYKTKTTNDTELLFCCLLNKENPFVKFSKSSMSVIFLDNDEKIKFFHNEQRPMYRYEDLNKKIISSTKDILIRSGLNKNSCLKVIENKIYEL